MRTLTTPVGVILICGSWLACTSSTQNVTGPSTTKCQVTAVAEPAKFEAGGGRGTVAVSTNRECSWRATSSDNWLQLGAEAAGQGDGKVAFSVTTNADPSQRRGAIAISEQQVAISQDASACVFTVPSRDTVSADGERRTINVTANGSECAWTARTETDWLTIVQGSQGRGSGQVVYEAHPTKGPVRSGELTIAGQRVAVTQGGGCNMTIAPTSRTVGAEGGSGTISVTTNAACPWSAQSETAWISITSATSGTGPGTVAFRVGAWDGPSRIGTLRIGEQVFSITQGNGCHVNIDPESHSVASTGGSGTIAVTAAAGCEWTATSSASWITITGGGSRNGNGTIQFAVAPTTGPARSATLTIAGRAFAINQSSGCTFGITPESHSVASTGGSGTVAVTTAAECGWTATSSAPWITIASGSSGSGNGTVQFAVAPTTGPARNGTLTIAGRPVAISQSSGCTFGINPESHSVASTGGAGSVAVTTVPECGWTATSSAPWITIASGGTGSGNGTVQFAVAPTTGPARSATLTIAGRSFLVSQGSGCTFGISPTSQNLPYFGGTGSVAVATGPGCTWTASSSIPWVRFTSGQSGTGPGPAVFTADETPSSLPRSATVTIAGQQFAISQDGGPCTFVVSPPSAALGAGGGSGTFEVNTKEACNWTATSNDAWLRVTAGGSGSGDGTVSFSADANPGTARNGTIVVGGRTFTASQAGASAMTGSVPR
jgi:all-beta uncharacterized protein/BACON domain-containing protein